MSRTVRHTVDLANLPPLTKVQEAEIRALKNKPDAEIDTSDIPELSADMWATAVRGKFCKPTKQPATVRLDSDILVWLKSQGKGYQTRMNAILREAMLADLKNHHR